MKITEFFDAEFPNFAVYNLYRMVASYVDGQKPSSRKVVYTVGKHNIKEPIKVNRLGSKVAEETEYLHGEDNLQGVIVGMAQNFPGTNNLEILKPESSFGNRCFPEAAAARYIFTRKSDSFDSLFHPADTQLLPEQEFEGSKIEPRYFVPTLPLILINGSEGIGSGWSQKILPRAVADIKKAIKQYLKTGKLPDSIAPSYRGFNGNIRRHENGSWEVTGKIVVKNTTTIHVTELPIGYNLDRYTSLLNKLEDDKIIDAYVDYSDPGENKFLFEVRVTRAWSAGKDERAMLEALKLVRNISENYTCIDENNCVREFKSEIEILKAYLDIRTAYYEMRKKKMLEDLSGKIALLGERYKFVKDIVENEIIVFKTPKADIEKQLDRLAYTRIDGSYDHLLKMPIHSFTAETMEELRKKIEQHKKEAATLASKTVADLWTEDLEAIK